VVGRGRTAGLSSPAGFSVGGSFLASAVIQVETADWEWGSLGLMKLETEIFRYGLISGFWGGGGGRSLKRRFTKLKHLFFRYKTVFSVSWKRKINNGFLKIK
jgi:hypothetical protein